MSIWIDRSVTPSKYWTDVVMSNTGQKQIACNNVGDVYISNNYGSDWALNNTISEAWAISMSGDGEYITVGTRYDGIYISDDYGSTWSQSDGPSLGYMGDISMSDDGRYQVAVEENSTYVYVSSNYGVNWSPITLEAVARYGYSTAISDAGQYQAVGRNDGIYVSGDYGVTWTKKTTASGQAVAISGDGQYQIGCRGTQLYRSTNYGVTWAFVYNPGSTMEKISVSNSGQYQCMVKTSAIYTSINYGVNWIINYYPATIMHLVNEMPGQSWYGIAMSDDGQYQTAVGPTGLIYTYNGTPISSLVIAGISMYNANSVLGSGYSWTAYSVVGTNKSYWAIALKKEDWHLNLSGGSAIGETIVSYLWDFGNGDTSASTTPSYAYPTAGNYELTVTITGSLGSTSKAYVKVFVVDNVADSYIDLGLSYLTEDMDGSINNPLDSVKLSSLDATLYGYGLNLGTRYLKGQKILPSIIAPYGSYAAPNVYWEYFSPSFEADAIYKAWDLELYGPPSWYSPHYISETPSYDDFYIETYALGEYSTINFQDLVITYSGIELDIYDPDEDNEHTVANAYSKNCYFDASSYMLFIKWNYNPVVWKFQGCTFIGRNYDAPYIDFEEDNSGGYTITDSTFIAIDFTPTEELEIYAGYGAAGGEIPTVFDNCYFSSNIKIISKNGGGWVEFDLNNGDPGDFFNNIIFTNCHFNYDFGATPPTALTATIAQKSTFDYETYSVPEETDPTILQRWVDDDYNTGLFGEPRLGAGAWYFTPVIPPPPPPPPATPPLYITSNKILSITQDKIDYDSNVFTAKNTLKQYTNLYTKFDNEDDCITFARGSKIVLELKTELADYETTGDKNNTFIMSVNAYLNEESLTTMTSTVKTLFLEKSTSMNKNLFDRIFEGGKYSFIFREDDHLLYIYSINTSKKSISGVRNVVNNMRSGGPPIGVIL